MGQECVVPLSGIKPNSSLPLSNCLTDKVTVCTTPDLAISDSELGWTTVKKPGNGSRELGSKPCDFSYADPENDDFLPYVVVCGNSKGDGPNVIDASNPEFVNVFKDDSLPPNTALVGLEGFWINATGLDRAVSGNLLCPPPSPNTTSSDSFQLEIELELALARLRSWRRGFGGDIANIEDVPNNVTTRKRTKCRAEGAPQTLAQLILLPWCLGHRHRIFWLIQHPPDPPSRG